jgi:hypothetical protein
MEDLTGGLVGLLVDKTKITIFNLNLHGGDHRFVNSSSILKARLIVSFL